MTRMVAGVILAGGLARRMGGGDKCLLPLGDKTLLEEVIARAAPQVGRLVLNANGDINRFENYGLPVAADVIGGYAGPLAGVLTGLEWARDNLPGCQWVVSFAADTPFFPEDLVQRFIEQADKNRAKLVYASGSGRAHPVFGLWAVDLANELRRAMVEEGVRKIVQWADRYPNAVVDFETDSHDPFFNVNTPQDLAVAEKLLSAIHEH